MSTPEKAAFRSGTELTTICFDYGDPFVVGKAGVIGMWVIMESGQMAGVPWAVVDFADGRIAKVNLASASAVELLT